MDADYYSVLGISRRAGTKTIRRAYRRLARESHPDVNPSDPSAEEKFRRINEAYSVLSDSTKRSEYDRDQKLSRGFSDFFREIISGGPPPYQESVIEHLESDKKLLIRSREK